MPVGLSWKPAVCVGLFLAAIQGVDSAPRDGGLEATRRLDSLRAELAAAQQAQDHSRLRATYAELSSLQPNNPEFHRGHGLASYLGGQYQEAIAALDKAADLQPDLAGVRLYLGMSLYRTNRFQEALQALTESPELAVGEPVALYWKGASHRALGQLAPAIAALETARRGAGPDVNLLQLLTRSYSERSAELLGQLLSTAPASAAARLLRAEELAMDGVERAALRELDKALASSPGLVGLHLAKGEILWAQGEYDAGAAEFRRELGNDPLSLEASLRLAAYHLDHGDSAKALEHLRFAARFRPSDHRIAELMASVERAGIETDQPVADSATAPPSEPSLAEASNAYRRGRPELAATLLESLLMNRPDFIEVRRLLTRCRLAEGADSKAADQLTQILELNPGDAESLYLAGKAYERLATETAEDLFALNPDSASVRLLRGEAFERGPRNDFEKALAEYRKAVELQPDDPAAHHAIGRVLFKMKRFDEAVPHLQEVLARNRMHGMANYLLGKIHLVNRNRVTAIKHLQAAVDARPGLSDAKRDLAQALVFSGRYEEGIGLYEKLLRVNADDASLHALMAVAYRTAGRMEEARMHADRARSLGAAKHRPDRP
jgi:tetratricopeptide (TPR) repeat protein